jgi:hypothetical protein
VQLLQIDDTLSMLKVQTYWPLQQLCSAQKDLRALRSSISEERKKAKKN